VARAHVASPMFEAGLVYYPDREWAREVIDLVSKFPNGAAPSAGVTDTVTQTVIYNKRRLWATPLEEEDCQPAPDQQSDEWDEDRAEEADSAYG